METNLNPEENKLVFADVKEWVEYFLSEIYPRHLDGSSGYYWCEKWWDHVDAYYRLHCLWLAWEESRHNGLTAPAAWLISYADPIMNHLLSEHGPFRLCKTGSHPIHRVPDKLPTAKKQTNNDE